MSDKDAKTTIRREGLRTLILHYKKRRKEGIEDIDFANTSNPFPLTNYQLTLLTRMNTASSVCLIAERDLILPVGAGKGLRRKLITLSQTSGGKVAFDLTCVGVYMQSDFDMQL